MENLDARGREVKNRVDPKGDLKTSGPKPVSPAYMRDVERRIGQMRLPLAELGAGEGRGAREENAKPQRAMR